MSKRPFLRTQAHRLSSSDCPMDLNETSSQKLLRESSLNRLRIARSQKPAMSSEEFYRQMERSTGTRMIPISSHGSLLELQLRQTEKASSSST